MVECSFLRLIWIHIEYGGLTQLDRIGLNLREVNQLIYKNLIWVHIYNCYQNLVLDIYGMAKMNLWILTLKSSLKSSLTYVLIFLV